MLNGKVRNLGLDNANFRKRLLYESLRRVLLICKYTSFKITRTCDASSNSIPYIILVNIVNLISPIRANSVRHMPGNRRLDKFDY